MLALIAKTIRQLSIDAVENANSGHPGLPLGCAEIGAYLYSRHLKINPQNPLWLNRDKFILSAGHGSMLLYSCLHLSGFPLTKEDLANFRQIDSKTPGHPEYHPSIGVECTTGPLGQGLGNAVGQALGYKILKEKFPGVFTNKVYCLASDGDIMEGITSEASSFAGHLCLDNLVIIYDSNNVSLDGPLSESFSENTKLRYQAYNWDVYEIDGNNFEEIDQAFQQTKNQTKPCLIIAHTIIGKGAPTKEGTYKVHGSPLGQEEYEATKRNLGLSEELFYIPKAVSDFFEKRQKHYAQLEKEWDEKFKKWSKDNPEDKKEFDLMHAKGFTQSLADEIEKISMKSPLATRSASHNVIALLAKRLPFLYGGSADLSSSDRTFINDFGVISSGDFKGRNIKFGVREFCMATSATGMAQTDMIFPFIGTFLVFSDYMRNAIRLAALSGLQVVYHFTHDSIFLGEDGPTHQPIEHLMSLRAIPKLHVIRPADSNEVKGAWISALKYKGPTALCLSRQDLIELKETNVPFENGVARGAYIVKKESRNPDFTIIATGSEVSLALNVASALELLEKSVRVISMPSFELFAEQSKDYQIQVLGKEPGQMVSIEAGVSLGWQKWIGRDGISISVETYGKSAPAKDIAKEYGFTVEKILKKLLTSNFEFN